MTEKDIKLKITEKQKELEKLDQTLTPLLGQRMKLIKEIKELQKLLTEGEQ